MDIEFIKPRNTKKSSVDWEISERTRAIVKYYAEYTAYSESDVVDQFLSTNILKDKQFIDWIKKKRNNKRILTQLELPLEESKIV